MIDLGKILIIACDAIVWMLALGCLLCVILTLAGAISYLRSMRRKKVEFEKRSDRDMAVIFLFFCLGMIFFTVITTLGALALARNI